MIRKLKYIFIAVTTLFCLNFIITSCSEESDCSMTARPSMVSYFYKYGASKNIILKDTLSYLTVKALETDSILLNAGEKISSFNAPLRYKHNEKEGTTAIVYEFDNIPANNDTIWVSYESSIFFVSIDCGNQIKQTITRINRYTENTIDKVTLKYPEANNYDRENIQIILR